jgi:hypothetical protein
MLSLWNRVFGSAFISLQMVSVSLNLSLLSLSLYLIVTPVPHSEHHYVLSGMGAAFWLLLAGLAITFARSLSEIAEVVLWFGFVGIGFWSMLTEANAEQPAVEHRLRPGTGFYRRRGFFLSSSARFKHVA